MQSTRSIGVQSEPLARSPDPQPRDSASSPPPPPSLSIPKSPAPPPLFSPSFALPSSGVLLKEGLLTKQTPLGNRPVYLRLTVQPLSILEYDSVASASPSAVHYPDVSWSFGHNPSNHSILLRTPQFNVVLLCSNSAEHREWRLALLRVQEEINVEEEERERENERQRAKAVEEEARLQREMWMMKELEQRKAEIAERKLKKLQSRGRRRSAEETLDIPTASTNASSMPTASSVLMAHTQTPSPSPPSAPPALSPSSRSSSEVSVVTPVARSPAIRGGGEESKGDELRQKAEDGDEEARESAEEGSHTDSETDGPLYPQSSLYRRSSQQRSLSLDDLEMNATAAAAFRQGSTNSAGGGSGNGEPRKLTDPTPGGPRSSTSASASASPAAAHDRRSVDESKTGMGEEERERQRGVEERQALALRAQKSRAFVKLFSLSEQEELITDYSCAVQRSILLHGRMYVSESHVCFFSSIFSHKTSIVIPMEDILHVQAAKVALVFDNAIRMAVQVGPLPVPVKVQHEDNTEDAGQSQSQSQSALSGLAGLKERARRFSDSSGSQRSRKSERSSDSHSPMPADEEVAGEENNEPEPTAPSATATSAPTTRFVLSAQSTMTASFTLSQEQIAYLISIQHPNVAQHFFASFLTRDHALTLLDGILKRKHGRDGFTSLSSSVQPTPTASASTSPALSSRSLTKEAQAGAAAEKARMAKMPVAQSVAPPTLPSSSSWMSSSLPGPTAAAASAHSTTSSSRVEEAHAAPSLSTSASQDLPGSLSFSASSSSSSSSIPRFPISHPSLTQSVSSPTVSALRHPIPAPLGATKTSRPNSPRQALSVDELSEEEEEEEVNTLVAAIDFGSSDLHPPLGDHSDTEDSPLLDSTFPVSLLAFFHLFLADRAPFSFAAFHAQRPSDSDYRVTRWRDTAEAGPALSAEAEARRREIEGDLLRHVHYRMQFVTPVGPPVTRVHRIQRWYAPADARPIGRLDSASLTPDITFGDCVIILERMHVEQVSGNEAEQLTVRVRILAGVRFRSRPWKMKPFIGLIQQRSREDSKKAADEWEVWARRRMQEEPNKVEMAKRKAVRRSRRSGVEPFLSQRSPAATTADPQSALLPAQSASSSLESSASTVNSSASAGEIGRRWRPPVSASLHPGPSWRPSPAFPVALPSPSTSSMWTRLDVGQRGGLMALLLSSLCLLQWGPGSRAFALMCVLCVSLLYCTAIHRLDRLQKALEDSNAQLRSIVQLLHSTGGGDDANAQAQAEESEANQTRPQGRESIRVLTEEQVNRVEEGAVQAPPR